MKRKAKDKRLDARRADYTKMLASRKDDAKGFKRPGTYKR